MKRLTNYVMIFIFWGTLLFFLAAEIFCSDVSMSEIENRVLAEVPQPSLYGVVVGQDQNDFEDYLKDQFPLRNQFMGIRSTILRVVRKQEINGAYIGKKGFLFEKITDDDYKQSRVDKNVDAVKSLYEFYEQMVDRGHLSVMILPTSAYVYDKYMPRNSNMFNQKRLIDDIGMALDGYNVVDVADVLKNAADDRDDIYYKTDHHWTMTGAFEAYKCYRQSIGMPEVLDDSYFVDEMTDSFRGSLYCKILGVSPFDSIYQYVSKECDPVYEVVADGYELSSLYDESKLEIQDKYQYFMGGNYGEARIINNTFSPELDENDNPVEKNLLIIKDSFANCFIPFVAADYANTYVLDPRYYKGDLGQYFIDNNVTDVLVLYNISNFISDKSLSLIGKTSATVPEIVEEPVELVEEIEIQPIYLDAEVKLEGGLHVVDDTAYEPFGFNEGVASKYCEVISEAAEILNGKATVYNILIPTSVATKFPDNLKSKISDSDQNESIKKMIGMMDEKVVCVPIFDTLLQHRTEYTHFRTDHHWTQLGAYYAYVEYCKAAGLDAIPLEEHPIIGEAEFLGSFYRKTMDTNLEANPDVITAYTPISESTMLYTKEDGAVVSWEAVRDPTTYQRGTRYSCYIAGDQPYSVIHNETLSSGKRCVVIKESFGNCFVPWLVDHYDDVYVVDYRYYDGTVSEIVNNTGASDVIFINNMSMTRNQFLVGKIKSVL